MSYSRTAKLMHWLVAGLIVTQFALAKLAEFAKEDKQLLDQLALLANHKSIGMTILALALIRLAIRLVNKPPTLPATMSGWQKTASHLSHFLLYGFLFAMPISGWLMSSAKAYSVSWFNLFAFPDLVSPNESLADTLHSIHHYSGEALFVVALIHIGAALKHHFFDRDTVLSRMASRGSWLLFFATCIITLAVFGRFFDSNTDQQIQRQGSQSESSFQASDLPIWKIDYADSFIRFSGDQAGAAFSGEWKSWKADIQFDAQQLADARFNVTIEPDSVFSNDKDRDEHIRSAEFFDVANFAQASFKADSFKANDTGFTALGKLTMKGFTSDTTLEFKVEESAGKKVLSGTATLDRLVWNIGSGDWSDTSWVGQNVLVEVRVATN